MPKLKLGSYLTFESKFFWSQKYGLSMLKFLTFDSLVTQFRGFIVIVFLQMGIFVQN